MRVIYVPCKNSKEARFIAKSLVERRLAVCVNIIPAILSVYRWKGKVEEEKEALVIIKTKSELVDKAVSDLKKIHSYKTPEIIVFPESDTTGEIKSWLDEELSAEV